jgi:hypothetical protein
VLHVFNIVGRPQRHCFQKRAVKYEVIAGNSNRPLAEAISAALNVPLTKASIRRFLGHGSVR